MDTGLKNFIIKFSIVAGTVILTASTVLGGKAYLDNRAETKRQELHMRSQAVIREMVSFCDFSKLTDEEQASITKCGDDVEAVRYRLKQIIDDRTVFWIARMKDISERIDKLNNLKRTSIFWNDSLEVKYQEALGRLTSEGKTSAEQFQAFSKKKKALDDWMPFDNPSGPTNPKIKYL